VEKNHEHSPIKILNSLGENSEKTKGIITLSDFIKDNNESLSKLLGYTKATNTYLDSKDGFVKDISDITDKKNEELIAKLSLAFSNLLEQKHRLLIAKLSVWVAGVSGVIGYISYWLSKAEIQLLIDQVNKLLK